MTIEFIPNDFSNRNVKERLKKSLEQTKILRGAVAFWTIDKNYFGQALIDALNHEESFYCVDVSSPTDFDAILKIHEKLDLIPAFHVHCKRIEPEQGIREHLMHSKTIVMDKSNGSTEIWIGSHNFTNYALSGINIESSLIIQIEPNEASDFKDKIIRFLVDIKSKSTPFDETSYYYFVALQDAAKTIWLKKYLSKLFESDSDAIVLDNEIEFYKTLELQGKDLDKLVGETIIVLGKNKEELKDLKKGSQKIVIHGIGQNDEDFLYEAEIRASDVIDDNFSKDVQFKNRRVGRKNGSKIILGDTKEDVAEQKLKSEAFYINIKIIGKFHSDKNIFVFSNPDLTKLWKSKEKSKRKNQADSKAFEVVEPYGLDDFQKQFLPKMIYQVLGAYFHQQEDVTVQSVRQMELFDENFKPKVRLNSIFIGGVIELVHNFHENRFNSMYLKRLNSFASQRDLTIPSNLYELGEFISRYNVTIPGSLFIMELIKLIYYWQIDRLHRLSTFDFIEFLSQFNTKTPNDVFIKELINFIAQYSVDETLVEDIPKLNDNIEGEIKLSMDKNKIDFLFDKRIYIILNALMKLKK